MEILSIIIGIVFVVSLVNAEIGKSTLTHKYDDIKIFSACSYYDLEDFDMLTSLKYDTLSMDEKNEITGNIKNGKWEWSYLEPYESKVIDKILYYNKTICEIDNKTLEEKCHEETITNKTYKIIVKNRIVWKEYDNYKSKYDSNMSFRLKKIQAVRYCADIEREWTERGFTIKVDIIPKFDDIIYSDLNWWDNSFLKKLPFFGYCPHCSEDTEMILLVSNSTFNLGAFLNESLELFYGNLTVNSTWQIIGYVYFNNETDYVLVDPTETFQLDTFIDEGNSTDFGTPEKDLVGWWHQNTVSGLDSSFYDLQLSISGNPTSVTGQIGHAVDYDINDLHTVAHSAHLNPNTQLTLMTWIKKESFTANQGFISKRAGGDLTYIYYSPSSGPGRQQLTWENSVGTVGDLGSSINITPGLWTHIAVTHNGTHVTFYTNGTAETPIATAVALTNTLTPPFYLASDGAGNFLTGILDEVRVYNRSLSADEIIMIYNNTVGTDNVTQFGTEEIRPPIILPSNYIIFKNLNLDNFWFWEEPERTEKSLIVYQTNVIVEGCIVYNCQTGSCITLGECI